MSLSIGRALVVSSAFVAAILISESAAAEEKAAPVTSSTMAQPAATAPEPLNLRAPDITHLFTQEQIRQVLATSFRDNIEEVEVEGERDIEATPRVWPGIFAPFWAIANPTQAWRIFAPLPPDQTRGMQYARVDATDAYLLAPAAMSQPGY